MTITQANLDVCQQALYLLRQDVGLPSLTDATSDTSLEWTKCQLAFDTAIAEVWNAHDWLDSWGITTTTNISTDCTEWPADLRTTLAHCVARELAIPLAGRVEDLKLWDTLYRQRVLDARVAALEQERKRIEDVLDREIVDIVFPHFPTETPVLPRSLKSIISHPKDYAIAEVWNAHDWLDSWGVTSSSEKYATDYTLWPTDLRSAVAHRVARDLVSSLTSRQEDLKAWDTIYRQKVLDARVAALEQERKRVTASPAKDVLDLILPRITADLNPLPRSIATITRRITTFDAPARQTVLAAHAWNFARVEMAVGSAPFPVGAQPYRFAGTMPANCARLLAVHTMGGRPTEWKVYGTTLVAMEPIVSAIYVKEMKDTTKWSPLVKKAYILRLAADTAQTEMPELQKVLEERYSRALQEAKVVDARESFTPSEQAGGNYYVDAMRGRVPPPRTSPHLPRCSFHGLV